MITPMDDAYLNHAPVAEAGMLIRRPVSVVYNAFINPDVTHRFWFTKSDGQLEVGKRLRWDWEMYGVSTLVDVLELEQDARIVLRWNVDKDPTEVVWKFTADSPERTFVGITNSGFTGTADHIVQQAMDSAAGFALVLAGAKAYLEYGILLNLVADRFPVLHNGNYRANQQEE